MASTPIDSLDIQIKTSADTADKALNKLVGTIGKISASLGGVNFNNFSVGVKNITSAMQGLQNIKMPDYNRLANGISKIGSINSAQIQQAGVAIKELSGSLRYLDSINVSDNSKQIAELANGIARLGYKSSTQAIDNIPRLAVAMRELMATLSTAPRVSQNIIDMTNALANLSRTGASSGRAANALGKSLNIYSTSANRARKSTFSLASAFGKMYASYFLLFRLFGKLGEAIDISSQLTEVQNVVDVTFGDMSDKVEEFTQNSIEQFGMSELSAKKFASTFQAMGGAMGIDSSAIESANTYLNGVTKGYIGLSDSMADVSLNLTKLTADMASFYNVDQKNVAQDLQSIFTGETRPMRQYGIDLTQATLKEWAMKQGLDANIESMSQAEKSMLRYQYVMANTGAAQGDFARTADTWANQIRILKQNFEQLGAVVGGTFINMLKPLVKALNNVMSHIIAFAQTVSNALGKIFGWKYEVGGGVTSDLEDGSGYADDIADGMGSAADNAKKLKQQLQGFDELNVLTSNTGTDSSSGSGGSGTGASGDGGQWVKNKSMLEEYMSEIDTLYELGEYIRDALISAMESIDWDAVYEKARGFGKGLAEFLNGLLAYDGEGRTLFGEVGKTLANTLNTIVYSALEFAKEFDFYQFGVNLADGINQFFKSFDFKALAETINVWLKGALTTATTFFKETDFELIGEKIGEFLSTLDLSGILSAVAENLWLALKSAFNLLKGLIKEAPFETALIGAFALFKYTKLGKNVAGKVVSVLVDSLKKKIGLPGTFTSVGSSFTTALGTAFSSLGGLSGILTTDLSIIFGAGTAAEIGTTLGVGVAGSFMAAVGGFELGKWLGKQLFPEDAEWYDNFKWLGDDGFFATLTSSINDGSWKGALDLWKQDIEGWFNDNLGEWSTIKFSDIFGSSQEEIATAVQNTQQALGGVATAGLNMSQSFADVADKTQKMSNDVNGLSAGLAVGRGALEDYQQGLASASGAGQEFENSFAGVGTSIGALGIKIAAESTGIQAQSTVLGSSTITGFVNAINKNMSSTDKPLNDWSSRIVKTIHDGALKFGSPSKTTEGFGLDTILGFNIGITNNIFRTIQVINGFNETVKKNFEKIVSIMGNIGAQAMSAFIESFKSGQSEFETMISDMSNSLEKALENVSSKLGQASLNASKINVTASLSSQHYVPAYATGGFPEDGWFRASQGEIMGKFDNGQSVVANNMQITDGIADAVYPAVYNAVSAALKNGTKNSDGDIIVQIDGRNVAKAVQKENRIYRKSTGKSMFDI